MSDYPTLPSWLIEQDGSMQVRQAAILAPPLGKHTLPERVEVSLRCQLGERYSQPGTAVLSEWMGSQSQSYDTYLCLLSDEVFINQGLMQGPKASAPPQKPIKLGSYIVEPEWGLHELSPPQPVDWVEW